MTVITTTLYYESLCGGRRAANELPPLVLGHSPSDWRAEQNNRSVVRRIINQTEGEVA